MSNLKNHKSVKVENRVIQQEELLNDIEKLKESNESKDEVLANLQNIVKEKDEHLISHLKEIESLKTQDEIVEDLVSIKESKCWIYIKPLRDLQKAIRRVDVKFRKYKKIIEKSKLFDAKFYLKTYRDARRANETPIEHFLKVGFKKGYRPNESFDTKWYGEFYEDVGRNGGYPFIHYIIYGKKENRFSNYQEYLLFKESIQHLELVFDEESYLIANEDVVKGIEEKIYGSAFEHFKKVGYGEVFSGKRRLGNQFPFFTLDSYKSVNEDLQEVDLQQHFFEYGYKEFMQGVRLLGGYYPFELTESLTMALKENFDETSYLEANPDLQEALTAKKIKSGWKHFLKYGIYEIKKGERRVHKDIPLMSEHDYVKNNVDIFEALKKGNLDSPYEHFLLHGVSEYLEGSRKNLGVHSVVYTFNEAVFTNDIKKEISGFTKRPLLSVVMPVYNVDVKWLEKAFNSLENQWYDNWELCIADDASTKAETIKFLKSVDNPKIKITFMEKNLNISAASNEALKLASGEYIVLMDNDDELTPDALYEVVKAINKDDAEFIYSDEDKVEIDGRYLDPHFKPDFAPDMFLSQNYLSHLGVIKKALIDKVGGWEIGLEGAQDYDLYLKVLELTDKIVHIPKVLYHWRKIPGSTASEFSSKSCAQDAGKKALENAMQRRGINATVKNGMDSGTYKVEYVIANEPLVSIVIPFKDYPELLKMSIESVLNRSTYQNFEIIAISNSSKEKATFKEMQRLEKLDSRVKFYEYNEPFNYSAINNYAVNNFARGEQIVLMNNDIEIISPHWIEELLMHSQRDEVGVVGAKLYYPDDTIQHAGVILGLGEVAGHSHKYFSRDTNGYFCRLKIIQNFSANTAALFMLKRSIYEELEGLNEVDLTIAFNDVDFCLRVQERGYKNIFTPYCEAYHHESISRGAEDNPEKIARFNSEIEYIKKRHSEILVKGDPYYNPNLTLNREDFGLRGLYYPKKTK